MRPAIIGLPVLVALALLVGWVGSQLLNQTKPPPAPAAPGLTALLGPGPGGFDSPAPDWRPDLPADHGAHPSQRAEAWNLSGSVTDAAGKVHDIQFSLSRLALTPAPVVRESAWGATQLYAGAFTMTATGEGTKPASLRAERLSRAALGLAGAGPASVFVEDWSLGTDGADLILKVSAEGTRLELRLSPVKKVVALGDLDLLPTAGEAPALVGYLMPRLAATGTLIANGESRPVTGLTRLEHGWGEVPTTGGALGAKRLGVQFDDGRELLCLVLARRDGSGTPIGSCALIGADGQVQSFRRREIKLAGALGVGVVPGQPPETTLSLTPLDLRITLTATALGTVQPAVGASWPVLVSGSQAGTPVAGRGRIDLGEDGDLAVQSP